MSLLRWPPASALFYLLLFLPFACLERLTMGTLPESIDQNGNFTVTWVGTPKYDIIFQEVGPDDTSPLRQMFRDTTVGSGFIHLQADVANCNRILWQLNGTSSQLNGIVPVVSGSGCVRPSIVTGTSVLPSTLTTKSTTPALSPSSANTNSPNGHGRPKPVNTIAIAVGSVLGGLAIAALVLILLFWSCRRSRCIHSDQAPPIGLSNNSPPGQNSAMPGNVFPPTMMVSTGANNFITPVGHDRLPIPAGQAFSPQPPRQKNNIRATTDAERGMVSLPAQDYNNLLMALNEHRQTEYLRAEQDSSIPPTYDDAARSQLYLRQ